MFSHKYTNKSVKADMFVHCFQILILKACCRMSEFGNSVIAFAEQKILFVFIRDKYSAKTCKNLREKVLICFPKISQSPDFLKYLHPKKNNKPVDITTLSRF